VADKVKKTKKKSGKADLPTKPLSSRFVLDNIIQSISDGVLVVQPGGSVVLVNQALCEILGFEEQQILGKGWTELFYEDPHNLEFKEVALEVIHTKDPIRNQQISYRTPEGSYRELLVTTSLLHDRDDLVGMVSLFKDVTELDHLHKRERRLLAQSLRLYEEKAESLDRVARAVAHEVRNPVTAIGGLASRLAKKYQGDQQIVDYMRRIVEATGRLEQVVDQVRDYAYVPRPNRRPVDIVAWLKEIMAGHEPRCRELGVELRLHIADDECCEAQIDSQLLSTAIHNLMENALDAMEDGGTLDVSLYHDQDNVIISILDSGHGIDEKDLPYLWDPFFTTKADRVGMSLAITKRIISEHEALLDVESPPEGGTKITMTLPIGEPPKDDNHRPPALK
jgi:PAS domain S-box-containing protein